MTIDKQTIVGMQMEMIKRFTANTMQRGWKGQQAGYVRSTVTHEGRADADVISPKAANHVTLDLQRFENSTCTCSVKRYCHHMAAVFFHLYAMHEKRTELFLMQHQQMRQIRSKERANRKNASASAKTRASDAELEVKAVTENDAITVWQMDIDKKFRGYFQSPLHQVDSFHQEAERYVLRVSERWGSPMKEWYQAIAQLFMILLAENRYVAMMDGYKPRHLEDSFERLFEQCRETFQRRWEHVKYPSTSREAERRIQQLTDILHKAVFRAVSTPVRWLDIYRVFSARTAAHHESYIHTERAWLTAKLTDSSAQDQLKHRYTFAILHLDMLEEPSSIATFQRLLEYAASQGEIASCLAYVEENLLKYRTDVAKQQLLMLLDDVQRSKSSTIIHTYLSCWEKLEQQTDSSEQRFVVMKSLLPHSFEPYVNLLERSGMYRQWLDLHMAVGRAPSEMNRAILSTIEQYDTEALLPIFHQSIDANIAERSRERYKTAVAMLRSLRACYVRLDREAQFQTYLEQLCDKYRVLRAFQEELRRSNLIS